MGSSVRKDSLQALQREMQCACTSPQGANSLVPGGHSASSASELASAEASEFVLREASAPVEPPSRSLVTTSTGTEPDPHATATTSAAALTIAVQAGARTLVMASRLKQLACQHRAILPSVQRVRLVF